jgi:zinc protease
MRGTEKRTRQQIQDELRRLRAQMGISNTVNGANVRIETVRANLPEVLRLVGEVLRQPAFSETEFQQLRQEMMANYEAQKSDPTSIGMATLYQGLAPCEKGDPRYYRTPDDQLESVKATTLADVRQFYKEFFGASNAELSIAGDFDAAEIQKLAADTFGGWRSPKAFTKVPYPYKDLAPARRALPTPDKENSVFGAGILINVGDEHPDFPALMLGNYMLGGSGLSSRFAARIRQKEGLSYGVASGFSTDTRQPSSRFIVQAIAAPQNLNKVEAAFREEIARALKDGFTAEEVAAGKKGLLERRMLSRSQDSELASLLAASEFEGRTMAYQADLDKKIAALTPQQVVEALRKHVQIDKLHIVKAGDFQKGGIQRLAQWGSPLGLRRTLSPP